MLLEHLEENKDFFRKSSTEAKTFLECLEEFDLEEDFQVALETALDSGKLTKEACLKLAQKLTKEDNTTSNIAPIATPKTFTRRDIKETTLLEGKMENMINEIGYKDFKNLSTEGRMGTAIKEANQRLKIVEKTLSHTTRLKEDTGLVNSKLSAESKRQLKSIKERIVSIIECVKNLES